MTGAAATQKSINDPFGDLPPYDDTPVITFPDLTPEQVAAQIDEEERLTSQQETLAEVGMSAHCMGGNAYDAMNEARAALAELEAAQREWHEAKEAHWANPKGEPERMSAAAKRLNDAEVACAGFAPAHA